MCVKLKYYSFKGEEEWDRKMKKENQRYFVSIRTIEARLFIYYYIQKYIQ